MKIFTEETGGKKPGTFIIIMDKREAKTLFEIVETAHKANRRRSSFRSWLKQLEEKLCCF